MMIFSMHVKIYITNIYIPEKLILMLIWSIMMMVIFISLVNFRCEIHLELVILKHPRESLLSYNVFKFLRIQDLSKFQVITLTW
jgi:hypothetical protein